MDNFMDYRLEAPTTAISNMYSPKAMCQCLITGVNGSNAGIVVPYSISHGKCGFTKLFGASHAFSLTSADQVRSNGFDIGLQKQLPFLHPMYIATTLFVIFNIVAIGICLTMFVMYMVWYICSHCIEGIDPLCVSVVHCTSQEKKFVVDIKSGHTKKYLYIQDQYGKVMPYSFDGSLLDLKYQVCAKTGIPGKYQKLFYKRSLVTEDNISIVLNGSTLILSLGLKGGIDHCEICYDVGNYICHDCHGKILCTECCTKYHKHPSRLTHSPMVLTKQPEKACPECPEASVSESQPVCSSNTWDDEITDSPNTSAAFEEASMIMTLAERFNITRFREYQKKIVKALCSGSDCLVIQPTGSGKSLCFQFPAVYQNKISLVITPTISLMQDHVKNCEQYGIRAAFLGSAQLDLHTEDRIFSGESNVNIVLVTPEWISKPDKQFKVKSLVDKNKICLIALDEAHLFHYWQEFRDAYKRLETLKIEFPSTPLICMTATAPPPVEQSISKILRNPVITKGSIDRPNITLACEEIPCMGRKNFSYFASRVSDLLSDQQTSIIYTDFIDNVGLIMSELNDKGIDSVAYYGEMDVKSRNESFDKWKSGDVKVMVATSAFGMGINKPDIRHIIRYGVPENICSWAQELGRAGRDEQPAKATIFYSSSDTDHAGAWIKGHLSNHDHCSRILNEFSDSWKYVMSNLANKCRRKTLLQLVGEEVVTTVSGCNCCDVCGSATEVQETDLIKELEILYNAIEILGPKGELKITQWIRGSTLAWTNLHDKSCMSYGSSRGHSEKWWRVFIRKCHVLGLVKKELKSIIKKSQHYGIQGIIYKTTEGNSAIESGQKLMLPQHRDDGNKLYNTSRPNTLQPDDHGESSRKKSTREGKGSHGISTIRRLLEDHENWQEISSKNDYQFPGVFSTPSMQRSFYTPNCMNLPQSTSNPHYMWEDIQISKSGWNKDREVNITVGGIEEKLMYRVSACNGVKTCPVNSCNYVVPISAQRPCSEHPSHKLLKTNIADPCPVQIAYVYPKNVSEDHRRWIFAFVRHQKASCDSLHNHPMHNSSKICSKVKQMIANATEINPSLKPCEIAKGKGVCAIPGAIDKASNHIGKISREVKKARLLSVAGPKWDISSFEKVADEVDAKDEELTGNESDQAQLKRLARPYLISAGIEDGINYVFCMSPLMCSLLAESEFIEADITYNETREYRYLFNMVAFNYTTMDWMVVSRIRMDKQDANAYALAYSKTFLKCKSVLDDFEIGKTLLGIVVDWSDAEIKGLGKAVGKDLAVTLLKGCKVHWTRSWQRVRDRILSSQDKEREKTLFSSVASVIPKLQAGSDVKHAFEVISKKTSAHVLEGVIEGFTNEDACFIDLKTNWTKANKWVEWWINPRHLNLLHKDYSEMPESVWERCPSDTNAVERKNLDSKDSLPQPIQTAVINLYKYDKAACAKHIAAKHRVSVSYCDKSKQGRKLAAVKRNIRRQKSTVVDKTSQYGPPDRQCHFDTASRGIKRPADSGDNGDSKRSKMTVPVSDDSDMDDFMPHASVNKGGSLHQCNKKYLGCNLKMRFKIKDTGKFKWFDGQILNFDPSSGKYGVFFPSDGQTVFIDPSQEADDIMFS